MKKIIIYHLKIIYINKRLPYTNKRYLCECCNKYLTKRIIEKHKTTLSLK